MCVIYGLYGVCVMHGLYGMCYVWNVLEVILDMIEESPYKVYVNVNALFTDEGSMIPKAILWEDGKTYEIQKVTDIRRAASLKAGATGIRYTIYVDGYETHLYYGDDHRWFVEAKTPHRPTEKCDG